MLELKHVTKIYQTAGLEKKALDDISINFRKNEFVSILGQSGSGKTTMLNIIGGLDHYTTGDLVINGKSTKKFKDRDWDAYRNNTIGFVFQSYNLISHQTALSNVEMAMTLSGVSKKQRRKRAMDALERVGLTEHVHKKPNQMSGGQMQRIAIARALVNDPDILLADEPTGALDSETSVQIMELLKEIAQERLVIMVTHNPELAEHYSRRIIKVLDGRILDDSHPFDQVDAATDASQFKKTKMGFGTALGLSFNNLLTKKGRTLLTAFAGSIGIIGIALILSLSNGVSKYVAKVQEDTLVSYPLSIDQQSSGSLLMVTPTVDNTDHKKSNDIGVDTQLTNVAASQITQNDLKSFKAYIDQHKDKFQQVTKDIQYSYDISPRIYAADTSDGITAVNPSNLSDKIGTDNPIIKGYTQDLEFWSELSTSKKMLDSQYDIVSGKMPSKATEVVLMVDEDNNLSDALLYSLGLRDASELNDKKKTDALKKVSFQYKDIIGKKFKLVVHSDVFKKENGRWIDQSSDTAAMEKLIQKGEDITIVGIVRPKEDTSAGVDGAGVGYTRELTDHISKKVNASAIAKEQLAHKDTNIFTGQKFADQGKEFSSDDLTDEQKMQLAQLTPEEMAAYVQQYNENANATYEDNLAKIGIIDLQNPASVNFYTSSFKQKQELKDTLEAYNKEMKKQGDDSKVLTYTDTIETIMSSITTMIGVITTVLVGFVAISLVVSSIMIAIITYISVLERTKEIGILRAMGASKRDVRRIFTAETAIEGLISGVLGILITLLLMIPINSLVEKATGIGHIAALPVQAAVMLIVISIVLTMFAGIIPSRMAAKKDPVEALRTE